jgi:hypothetical protein
MGEAKRKSVPPAEERLEQAKDTGWAGFLAKLYAGQSLTNNDYTRALLGLGKEKERVEGRLVQMGAKVGALLEEFRNQVVNVLVRQEIVALHLKELGEWQALPWWRRWRSPRPTIQPFPALPRLPQGEGNGLPTGPHPALPPEGKVDATI